MDGARVNVTELMVASVITVKIGNEERLLSEIDAQWINQQIHRRRADGHSVCVRVQILHENLDMVLSTPNCATGGGGRAPNRFEQVIFDLWQKLGLNDVNFTGGNVVAFLNQLKNKL